MGLDSVLAGLLGEDPHDKAAQHRVAGNLALRAADSAFRKTRCLVAMAEAFLDRRNQILETGE